MHRFMFQTSPSRGFEKNYLRKSEFISKRGIRELCRCLMGQEESGLVDEYTLYSFYQHVFLIFLVVLLYK